MFLDGLFFGLISFGFILFGAYLGDNKSMKEFNAQYKHGYDHAVEDMKKYGYYFDENKKQHCGEWIEKEEENV